MMNTQTNPYVGPRTFQRNEGHLLFGRDRDARDLLALVISERLVLFYAQSGAGKSSLINARLIPELEKRGRTVLPTGQVGGNIPRGLEVRNVYIYNLISSLVQEDMDSGALANQFLSEFMDGLDVDERGYVFHAKQKPDPEKENIRRPVLIIDQFEQLFSAHQEEWRKREDFFHQLAQALEDHPGLSIVLVLRQDYVAELDPYASLLPGRLRARYHMERFEKEAAVSAVKKPAAMLDRPFAAGVAERLVDDLSVIRVYRPDGKMEMLPGQYVEPVQLQVVCYELWERLPPHEGQITLAEVENVGDVNASLATYYEMRVKSASQSTRIPERRIRQWFSEQLITPYGTRNLVLREPDGRVGGLEEDVVRQLQDLVRAEQRGGATFYELTHDRLVEPILASNRRWEEEHMSPLQRQAELWHKQGRAENWLLTGPALAEVETWAQENADELTEIEDEFLAYSRRYQMYLERQKSVEMREALLARQLDILKQTMAKRTRWLSILFLAIGILISLALVFTVNRVPGTTGIVLLVIFSLVLGYLAGRYLSKTPPL